MTIKDWIQTYARELEGSDAERELEAIVGAARADEISGVRGWTEYDPDPKYSSRERFHVVPYTYLTNRLVELRKDTK